MFDPTVRQLSLAPLGSGDLIDRAVRLYRRNLFILIRIAAPPVIVASTGWILCTVFFPRIFRSNDVDEALINLSLSMASFCLLLAGYLFTLIVMGGATRNLVAHLLRNDPVSARETYRAVQSRFWGLFLASLIVLGWIIISVVAASVAWYLVVVFVTLASLLIGMVAPVWLSTLIGIISFLVATVASFCVFFLIVGRIAYVPQVMLVEGKGVFDALARSFTLASGNVRRLMAMTLFTTFATYSALMILLIPLGWYGYLSGVDLMNSTQWPAWYAIAYSVLGPLSSILLTPVWMLGLSLLYVDERVRHEGYDIELLAARDLGELPEMAVASPFGPALSTNVKPPQPGPPMASGRVLNLS